MTTEEQFFTEWEETFDSFDSMNLHENLLRGIYAYGEPSRVPCSGCQRPPTPTSTAPCSRQTPRTPQLTPQGPPRRF
jgi:hypothetical protein